MKKSPLMLTALTCLSLNAHADEKESPLEEEVTTIAPVLESTFYKSRSTYSLDEEDLEASPSVATGLDGKPGIQIQETSRGGGTVFMRGLIGPENLILIDGLRFNQSTFRTGPNQYLDTIGLSAISNVDAINGPSGLVFGSNAIGGLINLKTNSELVDEHAATALVGFDSARSATHGLFKGSFAADKATLRLGLNYGREGTLHAGEGSFLTSGLQEDGTFLGSAFQRLGWSIGLDSKPTDNFLLSAKYLASSIQDAPRLDRIGEGRLRIANNDDHFAYLKGTLLGPKFFDEVSLALMFHKTNELQTRYRCEKIGVHARNIPACAKRDVNEITRKQENEDRVTTLGFVSSLRSELFEFLSLNTGLDFYHDQVSSTANELVIGSELTQGDGNFPAGANYSSGGIFLLLNASLYSTVDHSLELQGGIRGDFVSATADEISGVDNLDYNHIGPVGSLNLSYLSSNMTTWLGWHQGFRPPNLQETTLLGDTGNFFEIPNPDLLPERSNSFELGTKYDHLKVGRVGASLFVNLIDNKITREAATLDGQSSIDGKEVRQRINEGDAYYYGLEAEFESKPFYHLSVNAAGSFIEGAVSSASEDDTFDAGFLHDLFARSDNYQHARRLPPLAYRLGVKYERSRFQSELWISGNGAQRKLSADDRKDYRICELEPGVLNENCNGSDDWATLNIKGTYRFEKIHFSLGVENILDVQYRRHGSGVPGTGLGLSGNIKLTL